MNLRRRRRSIVIIAMVAAAVAMVLVTPGAALADTPTSAITVSQTTLQRGATFTVTETIYNPENFVVTGAKAALYGKEAAIADVADLVSCTVACGALGSSYRAVVGDLAPLQSATVTFTLKVKDTAPLGTLTCSTSLPATTTRSTCSTAPRSPSRRQPARLTSA